MLTLFALILIAANPNPDALYYRPPYPLITDAKSRFRIVFMRAS